MNGFPTMHPTAYSELNDVLQDFHERLAVILGSDLVGIYLHGSLAIGDFDEKDSDVDLLVVKRQKLTTAQVAALKEMHMAISARTSHFAKTLAFVRYAIACANPG